MERKHDGLPSRENRQRPEIPVAAVHVMDVDDIRLTERRVPERHSNRRDERRLGQPEPVIEKRARTPVPLRVRGLHNVRVVGELAADDERDAVIAFP